VLYKIKLKNADENVLLDDHVYEALTADAYLAKVDFVNNLRRHSSGCAVFQKTWKKAEGGYKTETLYLHRLIAERFLKDDESKTKNLVGALNGNKLDCKENNRYRAVISVNRKSVHIGMYDTPEEAARAYNKKSKELYGDDGKINIIRPK